MSDTFDSLTGSNVGEAENLTGSPFPPDCVVPGIRDGLVAMFFPVEPPRPAASHVIVLLDTLDPNDWQVLERSYYAAIKARLS